MSGLAEILEENERLRRRAERHEAMLSERDAMLSERDAMLAAQREELAARGVNLAKVTAERDVAMERLDQLERALKLIELRRAGPASQRFVPDEQSMLPIFPDVTAPPRAPKPEPAVEEAKTDATTTHAKPRRRTREDFSSLPSHKVKCPASKDATCISCGGALKVIGQATSFRIGWVPGHFVVEDVVRDKCACPSCPSQGVLTVPAPYALDKALCADSLLARVIVDKFADHLPLNRQADRMAREGFEVSTTTLSAWVVAAAAVLKVVAAAVKAELFDNAFLQGDDTGFPIQDGGDGTLRKGRMWAFSDQQQVFYAFTETKEGEFPTALLDGYTGECLLVDGGSEFNQVVAKLDLDRAGCWSHLRTYFIDAQKLGSPDAELALATIRDVFMIERELADLDADARLAARTDRSKPLVDGFFTWVKARATVERPKSKLMEALTYATNQENALRQFLERGDIPIHNNLSERMLRQHVVGRKNWLFARSDGGAEAAATMFTLIGSCWLQGVDPHRYLVDVLGRVQDHKGDVRKLTPRSWRIAMGHPVAP